MTEAPTRPVLRWHGSKWRIAPWIIGHFPPHRVYVEPFGGGGAVLLRKERSRTEIYNDLDRDLVRFFRVARSQPDRLAAMLALTPFARDEYDALYQPCDDDLDAARSFVARSFMGMNSKGAVLKSGFDARVNDDAFCGRLRSLTSLPDEVIRVAARFSEVVIENVDAVSLVGRFSRPDALIYADPPYVASARSGAYYAHEMSDDDHVRLIDALQASAAMVLLSGYASELYDSRLAGWKRIVLPSWTDGGARREEVLWINPRAASFLDPLALSMPLLAHAEALA